MILATRKNGTRDGELVLISKDRKRGVSAREIAPTLQAALDEWAKSEALLRKLSDELNRGATKGSFDVNPDRPEIFHSPLPRAYGWMDGSAYLNHVILVRKARGAELPPTLRTDPLMYQGGSDHFLDPMGPIEMASEDFGIDFESEVVVIVDDVPMGVDPETALSKIRFIAICNDVSLRNLIPDELAKGFGFLVSKPSTAFAPFVLTPEEIGSAWNGGRLHLDLVTRLNGLVFGNPNAGPEMHFHFGALIAHAAKTRPLRAGTLIGSGTVSNEDRSRGSSCIAEKRMIEKIDTGAITTPFMKFGDRVQIEMRSDGVNLFGTIDQVVVKYQGQGAVNH